MSLTTLEIGNNLAEFSLIVPKNFPSAFINI